MGQKSQLALHLTCKITWNSLLKALLMPQKSKSVGLTNRTYKTRKHASSNAIYQTTKLRTLAEISEQLTFYCFQCKQRSSDSFLAACPAILIANNFCYVNKM